VVPGVPALFKVMAGYGHEEKLFPFILLNLREWKK
jgi:hypothetical protein